MWGSRSAPPSMRAMATAGSGPPPSSGCHGPVKPMMAGSRPGEWGQSPRMSRGRVRTPFPGTTRSGPWAMLQQRDGTGRVSQTARPFVALLLLGRQRRGRREWAWGVQTCYAGAGRPSQGPPGPAPGQCCNKGTGRAGFLRPPVPLLLSSSWAASVGDGGSGPGAYRLVTPVVGQSGPAWGRTCLLRRRRASRGRPGAYMPVTPAQDALPRGHPVRPLGNAATKGRDGQGFSDRPVPFCRAPLLGRRWWTRRGSPWAYRLVTPVGLLWRPALTRPLGGEALWGRVRRGTATGILRSCGPSLEPNRRRPGPSGGVTEGPCVGGEQRVP